MGGASGTDSLLLNTKASQEAVCSRAPAAIVPGQKPESRDAGVSRFAENGSHLAAVDTAEGHAGHVGDPGSSGNARIGSHPAETDTAEGHAGHVGGPGSSGNAENGSHLAATVAAEGLAGGIPPGVNENGRSDAGTSRRARHARHFPPENAANDTWQICPV